MDKAPAYGAGDSGFESRYGLFFQLSDILRAKAEKKFSAQPESNQRPRDINCEQLQSPALPTELYADLLLIKKEKKMTPEGIEPPMESDALPLRHGVITCKKYSEVV